MSPIVGLTTDVKRQFPSLGILRKGKKEVRKRKDGSTVEIPVDLEFFRFVNEQRPDVERAFHEAYGENPTSLSFYFQYDDIDDVWDAWQEEWVAGGLVHRCDGETMVLWRTPDGGYSTERRPCPYHSGEKQRTAKQPGCKPVGRLRILLPKLLEAGHIGDVTLLTGSKHDIMSIQACLEEIQHYRQDAGLRGIEFVLRRDPREISTPGNDGKRVRRTKSLITIAPAARWVQFQLRAAERRQFMLPAGEDEDLEDEPDLDYAAAVLPEPSARQVDQETGEIMDPGWCEGDFEELEEEAEAETHESPRWAHISDDDFTVPGWFEPTKENFQAAFDVEIRFGKHRGKTLGEIYNSNLGYIAWLTTRWNPGPAPSAYQKKLKKAAIFMRSYKRWYEHEQAPKDREAYKRAKEGNGSERENPAPMPDWMGQAPPPPPAEQEALL